LAEEALFKECIPATGPECFFILAGKSIEYTGLREASRLDPTPTRAHRFGVPSSPTVEGR